MEWLNILLGGLVAIFGGLNIFQFIFFRTTKKEYEAKAEKAATESSDAKHDYLVKRVESMEKLYQKQGEILDSVRQEVLRLQKDVEEKDRQIIKYEVQIKTLNDKVSQLDEELRAYKIIKKHNEANGPAQI